ncbi:MAG: subtilase family N-terminal domain-containing protein [Oscillochloridaceae bacterium]|nr:hypothetical protein [Chloroflexaceae bacterium]MDW8389480.1 subtilase family N-terminal domain-containing protein [Oscillochloridaceae bacterium]
MRSRDAKAIYSLASSLAILIIVLAFSILPSCTTSQTTSSEILIALKLEAIPLLRRPEEPDPFDTGIPSLDSLNRKWDVHQMIRVFPDVSPDDEAAARYGLAGIYKLVIPGKTDLAEMIQDYRSDPHIDYAELNQPYEIK